MNLLLEIEETILILVKVGEHVEALSLTDVVDHIILQELVDVICRDFAELHAIDSLEGGPWLEPVLLGQLLALFLYDLLIF